MTTTNTSKIRTNNNNNNNKKRVELEDLSTSSSSKSIDMFLNETAAAAAACCCFNWCNRRRRQLVVTTLALLVLAQLSQITTAQLGELSSVVDPASQQQQQSAPLPQQISSSLNHQEVLVQPNTLVRIECKIPKSQRSSSYWNFLQRTAGKEAKPHLLYFGRAAVYQGKPDFGIQLDDDPETGAYDLVIQNATYELNDGIYYCDYQDPETKHTINREFRLTVLIPPQAPTVQPVTLIPAREGQEHQLQCQSLGGNPEPNITWFRNEQPVALGPLGLRIEKAHANGSTTSTLSWIPTMEDNGASYKCLVWNKAMSSLQAYERELKLQVEYAPRINVGPYNPLRVQVGHPLVLPCLVDANPPVKGIRWFKDGHFISNQYNHSIGEIKISDAGTYTCQADNGIPPLSAGLHSVASLFTGASTSSASIQSIGGDAKTSVETQLQLQALYPPRVHLRPAKAQILNEGESLSLNCSVDSWPPAHEFIWTKQDDSGFRRHSSSPNSVLEFYQVTAADMGNYTCTAINRMEPSGHAHAIERQGSASTVLRVRHRPGMAEIVVGHAGVTELGAKTQLHCHAKPPGYPEPLYTFWKWNGHAKLHLSKPTPSPVHTIHAAKSDDETKYGCSASNEMGQSSEAEGELIVQEPPAIIHDASARREEDTRPLGDHPYSITVRAHGKPEPKVSWFHRSPVDGRRVELGGAEARNRFHIETITRAESPVGGHSQRPKFQVISTLTFKNPLSIDDRGRYTVEFNNGLSRSASEHFQLRINHAPIPAPRNGQQIMASSGGGTTASTGNSASPVVELQRWKAGFDLGETVNLTCRVSAHPRPEFFWHSANDQMIENNPRYSVQVHNPIDDIWESTLTFSQAQESDYGDYACSMANRDPYSNQLGDTLRILINLSRKTVPDAPRQLEAVDATQDSITLQWLAGFDGGYALNHYLVQYAPDDGSGQSLAKRFGAAAESQLAVAAPEYLVSQHLDAQQPQQQQYPKLYDCLAMNPCTINHLLARQAYVFRVRAKNELGFSEFSDELKAQTRANISQIPRILDASFDTKFNVLHFRVESGSDFLLNNLNARIEVRSLQQPNSVLASQDQQQQQPSAPSPSASQDTSGVQEIASSSSTAWQPGSGSNSEWRFHSSVLIRQERAEAYLNVNQHDTDQIRVTLCSRTNESLCGPESVINLKMAASSFLHDQRGLSLSILMSTLVLIVVLAAFATSVHSCCFSRKGKKAAAIERADGNNSNNGTIIDNKPVGNGVANSANQTNGLANGGKSSHGSTTSTNSTSANGGSSQVQSIDSINGALTGNGGGSASDHSSDHSRQAKLDSLLPPNYNHYADRASIMMEQQMMQQQQQQQQQQQHQQGLISDKMSSPFGLPNSALLSVAQQQQSPMMSGAFTYGHHQQLQPEPAQQMHGLHQLDHSSMMSGAGAGPLLMGAPDLEQADGQQQQQMWPGSQQLVDDYDYNALGYSTGAAIAQQQQHDQMIDPTYGTTGGMMMPQHSAAYDNSANNNSQFQSYLTSAYQPESAQQYQQQRAQYQQEIAVAQQQMYGTLTRSGYATGAQAGNNAQDQQQQQQLLEAQYSSASGLMQQQQQPPPPPPPSVGQQPQESDYGTVGARNGGRLIREIIV